MKVLSIEQHEVHATPEGISLLQSKEGGISEKGNCDTRKRQKRTPPDGYLKAQYPSRNAIAGTFLKGSKNLQRLLERLLRFEKLLTERILVESDSWRSIFFHFLPCDH